MTLDQLLALLPDNGTGDIGADDMRAIVTDLFTRDVTLGTAVDGVVGDLVLTNEQIAAVAAELATLSEQGAETAEIIESGRLSEDALTTQIVSVVDDAVTPISAVQDVVGRIRTGQSDVSILIVSDSTAAMTTPNVSWANQLQAAFAALFPTHTISYRLWNQGTGAYDAASVTAGSGARIINIWNGGASSRNWDYQADATRSATLVTATAPDLVVFSHGHNEYGSTFASSLFYKLRDRALTMIESVRMLAPSASVLVMSQNPELNNVGLSEKRADIYRRLCMERGYGFLDIAQVFHDDGRALTDLVRNVAGDYVHPTAAGYTIWLNAFMALWVQRTSAQSVRIPPASFTEIVPNLAPDTIAANFTGVNCTITNDATYYESGSDAVKLMKTVTGSASEAYMTLPARRVAGQEITIAVRMRVPTALKNIGGRLKVTDGVTGTPLVADVPWDYLVDQFVWRILTAKVAPTATTVRVYVAADSSFADPITDGVVVDRVVVTLGRVPKDAVSA